MRSSHKKLILFVAGAAVLLVLVAVYQRFSLLPGCMFRKCTGLHCPGCGMTRATHALLHGRLWEAFRMNPVGVILLPLVTFGMVRELVAWAWERPEWSWRPGARVSLFLAVLVIGFGVLRNVPGFEFLLPGGG